MSEELKPCPFCGKNMQKRDWEPDSEFIVWCQNCGAIGPNELTIELACDMWNLRRPEAELRARIAELEAQTRWIPVGERLPEDGQDVAVLDIADHCVDRWRYSPLIADYFSRHYSHWMPLEKWMESIK